MGPCGCCPPRGRGDPQVGTLTPWVVALGSPRAATPPPAAITCTLQGGFGAPSPSFCGLCPSQGLSPPLSAGIWGWGGRAGCPPPSSAGWAQSPCARSPGGGCDAPPGFLLYHNCEALGIGREQKKGFLFIILGGVGGSAATSCPPSPGSESPPRAAGFGNASKLPQPGTTAPWVPGVGAGSTVEPCPHVPHWAGAGHRPALGGAPGAILQPPFGTNAAPCRRPSGAAGPCGLSSSASQPVAWCVCF